MEICIGSDHRGFDLKNSIIKYLFGKEDIQVNDLGCFCNTRCDYNDIVHKMHLAIQHFGILICNTGIGMSVCANKYKNIRAALCLNTDMAQLSREHIDCNVLVLPAKYISIEDSNFIVDIFLKSNLIADPFYLNRIKKVKKVLQ